MRVGVVSAGRVHNLRHGLVSHELQSRERHGHAQGGGVGDVKCGNAFGTEDLAGALRDRLVGRAVQLHTLLDNCKVEHARAQIEVYCLPSNGFISASLEIVAAAPLAAMPS